jgi:hypothetical protein
MPELLFFVGVNVCPVTLREPMCARRARTPAFLADAPD